MCMWSLQVYSENSNEAFLFALLGQLYLIKDWLPEAGRVAAAKQMYAKTIVACFCKGSSQPN